MKKGDWLGYVHKICPNCKRRRVELWSNGHKEICEKCGWCIQDNDYFVEEDEQHYMDNDYGIFGRSNHER